MCMLIVLTFINLSEMCKTNKDKKIVREKTNDFLANVSRPLNRNVYTSNVHQRYSQKGIFTYSCHYYL